MGTARDLGIEYVSIEIERIKARLEIYNELYQYKKIKCITLKRLIDIKENELRILNNLHKDMENKEV